MCRITCTCIDSLGGCIIAPHAGIYIISMNRCFHIIFITLNEFWLYELETYIGCIEQHSVQFGQKTSYFIGMVILLKQACLEPLAAQQNRLNYGLDKVQLRIYDTDKVAADNLAASEWRRNGTRGDHPNRVRVNWLRANRKPEAAVHSGLDPTRRIVLQDIAEEAEGTQPDHGP